MIASLKNRMRAALCHLYSAKAAKVFLLFVTVVLLSGCILSPRVPVDTSGSSTGCATCSVFEIVYSAGTSMYKTFQEASVGFAQTILWFGFLIWLGLHVFKFVATFKEPDVSAFWNELATRLFWATFASLALLPNMSFFTDDIFNTIFDTFVNLSTLVVSQIPGSSSAAPISCALGNSKDSLLCLINATTSRLSMGTEIMLPVLPLSLLPTVNPFMLMSGCIAIVVCYMMIIILPLLLLETILFYFITVAMLPLWIVAYVFPITRDFSKKAWEYIIPIFFQILGMCVFMGLSAQVYVITLQRMYPKPFYKIFEKALHSPFDALVSPVTLIFISLFLYFFGGVLLHTLNLIFGISGQTGSAVSNLGSMAASKMKQIANKAENATMGEAASNKKDEKRQEKRKEELDKEDKKLKEKRENASPEEKKRIDDQLKRNQKERRKIEGNASSNIDARIQAANAKKAAEPKENTEENDQQNQDTANNEENNENANEDNAGNAGTES